MKKFLWFVVALLAFVFLISFVSTSFLIWGPSTAEASYKDANIAVMEVEGMIMESLPFLDQLRELKKNPNLKALVVRIDSPGGAVGASQEIYYELKKLQSKMPVIVSMGNLAASGGLYISLGSSKVYALEGTITGSMGVLATMTNFSRLLEKVYVDPITFKSGELKDAGNPTKALEPKAKEFIQKTIEATFVQFQKHVFTERKVSAENQELLKDGRIVLGSEAKEMGLVHEIGSFMDAIEAAKVEAKIPETEEAKLAFLSRKPKGLLERVLEVETRSLFNRLSSYLAKESLLIPQVLMPEDSFPYELIPHTLNQGTRSASDFLDNGRSRLP